MDKDDLGNQLRNLFSDPTPEPENTVNGVEDTEEPNEGTLLPEWEDVSSEPDSISSEPVSSGSESMHTGWDLSVDDDVASIQEPSEVTPYLADVTVPQDVSLPTVRQYLSYADPISQYRLQPDQLIDGRYKVLEPLGAGSFAEVYKCQDVHLDQKFAVKLMSLPTATEDVLREARIAARLQHSAILRVVNIGRLNETGTWYIVMDYREGSRTLETLLDEAENNLRRLSLSEKTLRIVCEVAQALDHAHEMGVIHQDVKPSNIIVDFEDHAYLSDFGLAMTKRPMGTAASMKTLGAQSGMSGTIPYMAPEEFEEVGGVKPVGPSADIYSLAVVTYEMLIGQLPYPGKAAGPIIRQIVEGIRTPPRQLNAEIPREVETVLLRSLSVDPADRPQTAMEFAASLKQAAQAYITDEEMYEQACELFQDRQWREALASLEELERLAPGYRETRLYMERARKQVQLLDLYDQAVQLLDQAHYQACLDKLEVLVQLDPAFEVTSVSSQAKRALIDQLYQQATSDYREGDYARCLNAFEEIWQLDADAEDPEGIAEQARRLFERQQYLQGLYETSIEQTQQEDWQAAEKTLQELYSEAPYYADVEARLTMVRYIARLSAMYDAAQECFEGESYGDCIARLEDLTQMNNEYRSDQIVRMREQAIVALYDRAESQLKAEQFERALADLDEFERHSDAGDPRQLRERIHEGIAARELRRQVDALYSQATAYLDAHKYRLCLAAMAEVQELDPSFVDVHFVVQRARNSLCSLLYADALGALMRRQYREAQGLWNELREVDPAYPDPQNLGAQIERRLHRWDWLKFWQWLSLERLSEAFRWVRVQLEQSLLAKIIAGCLILVLLGGGWGITRLAGMGNGVTAMGSTPSTALGSGAPTWTATLAAESGGAPIIEATATSTVSPTPLPTETPTGTTEPSPTFTATTVPTHTPQPTATPEATSTETPTLAPTGTTEPSLTSTATTVPVPQAVVVQSVSLYRGPGTRTEELGVLEPEVTVAVLGRADEEYGRWLHVRTAEGREGFVWEPWMSHELDWAGLEVVPVTPTPAPTATPACRSGLTIEPGDLEIIRIWPSAVCTADGWTAYIEVQVAGGDGCTYQFYWDGEPVEFELKESEPDVAVILRPGRGTLVGTVTVVSGGKEASQETSLSAPNCD